MAKTPRTKNTIAENIRRNIVTPRIRPLSTEKSTERNVETVEQLGNIMIMIKDLIKGQEGIFEDMIDVLKVIPETTEDQQKQSEIISQKMIEAILKLEKQMGEEQDPENKKKLQGAIDVLKTQGASAFSIARPQMLPSTFAQALQNALGVAPYQNQRAGGFLKATRENLSYKAAGVKSLFGVFPKQDTFEDVLAASRTKAAGQEAMEAVSPTKAKATPENAPVVATILPKETLDFYNNVMEGLNIIVMNQDKTLDALGSLTPESGDDTNTSPSPSSANAVPNIQPANDLVSGYGNRVLITPTGAYALNNADDVIAGTNLFPKGSLRMGGMSSTTNNSARILSSSISTARTETISNRNVYASGLENNPLLNFNPSTTAPTVINNIDNSTTSSGSSMSSPAITVIRDVHGSHLRYQDKRLTSLLA